LHDLRRGNRRQVGILEGFFQRIGRTGDGLLHPTDFRSIGLANDLSAITERDVDAQSWDFADIRSSTPSSTADATNVR
jgi:hypothetical protein